MSYVLLEQIDTKPLEEIQDAFIKMIVEIRPIKLGRTLLVGESKSDRWTKDTKLRKM